MCLRESAPLCPEHRDLRKHRTEGAFQRLDQGSGVVAMEVNYSVSLAPVPLPPALLATVIGSFSLFRNCSGMALPLPHALKDCSVRPHCHQITGRGDFSFPFLKLDYLRASTTELEPLAERGPFSDAFPVAMALRSTCWGPALGQAQATRQAGTFTAPGSLSKMLVSRGR